VLITQFVFYIFIAPYGMYQVNDIVTVNPDECGRVYAMKEVNTCAGFHESEHDRTQRIATGYGDGRALRHQYDASRLDLVCNKVGNSYAVQVKCGDGVSYSQWQKIMNF